MKARSKIAIVFIAALSVTAALSFALYHDHLFAKSSVNKYSLIGERIDINDATDVWFYHDKGIDVTELITLTQRPDQFKKMHQSMGCEAVDVNRSSLSDTGRAQLWWWNPGRKISDRFECDVGNAFVDGAIEHVSPSRVRVWMRIYTM